MDPILSITAVIKTVDVAIAAGRTIVGASNALDQAQLKMQLADVMEALVTAKIQLADLRSAAQEESAWKARKDSYTLIKTPVGTFVYESKTEPKHFACPKCLDGDDQIQILQPTAAHLVKCAACETRIAIAQAREQPHPVERSADSWINVRRG